MSYDSNQFSEDKAKNENVWSKFKRVFCCGKKEPLEEAPHVLDDKLNDVFENWSKKHHVDSVDKHRASELLKAQLEEYQRELEERRLEFEFQGKSAAMPVTGKRKRSKRHKLAETDDKLPYELKSIENLNQKMKDKTSGDKSPSKRTSKSILVSGKQKSKSNSKSDSTGSENELEKGEHLADLLMEIMQEAQEGEETYPQLPGKQLALMSRNEPAHFEHLMVEFTKECLFLSLPTNGEMENWDRKRGRPLKMGRIVNKLKFLSQAYEVKNFCPDCLPRHWNRTCAKF